MVCGILCNVPLSFPTLHRIFVTGRLFHISVFDWCISCKIPLFEKFDGINDSTRIMIYVRMMFSAFPQLLFCLLLAIFVRLSMRPKWLDSVMFYLGKNSTTLWFIHTFICYYLFHDIIYALKFPLLIFMVLISVSLILAYLFDMIHLYCWKKLRALCCRVRLGRGNLTI